MARTTKSNDKGKDLPPGVKSSDLKAPKYHGRVKGSNALTYEEIKDLGLLDTYGRLTFYKIKAGWVLLTLHISNPSRRQRGTAGDQARSYAIGVADSQIYTVGRGPHVESVVEVHLTKSNLERLRRYVDLYRKGLEDANTIRDRISSRRARGTLKRSSNPWDKFW